MHDTCMTRPDVDLGDIDLQATKKTIENCLNSLKRGPESRIIPGASGTSYNWIGRRTKFSVGKFLIFMTVAWPRCTHQRVQSMQDLNS